MFKDKIIAAFKLKYPGINLSKTRLAAIATKIETKVIDDETKIDAALAAMDDAYAFSDIAKEDDKVRTLEARVKAPKKEDDPTETAAEKAAREAAEAAAKIVPAPDDAPAWAKALIEQNKNLANDLAVIKGEKIANTIKGKATELLKEVPVEFWEEWTLPANEDGLTAFAEKVNTKFTSLNQQRTEAGFGLLGTPKAGTGGKGDTVKASKEEVASLVESIM